MHCWKRAQLFRPPVKTWKLHMNGASFLFVVEPIFPSQMCSQQTFSNSMMLSCHYGAKSFKIYLIQVTKS